MLWTTVVLVSMTMLFNDTMAPITNIKCHERHHLFNHLADKRLKNNMGESETEKLYLMTLWPR